MGKHLPWGLDANALLAGVRKMLGSEVLRVHGTREKVTTFSRASRIYWVALGCILVASFAIRFPLVYTNLPVTSHIDERPALMMFNTFAQGDLNPEWFHHPTLYYYLTYVPLWMTQSLNNSREALVAGRIVNLVLQSIFVVTVFFLGRFFFRSQPVGLLAAGLTAASPIILYNASYMVPDMLFALFAMLSLLFMENYARSRRDTFWLMGIVFAGLAVSTKYTALSLVVSYLVWQLWLLGRQAKAGVLQGDRPVRFLDRPLPWSIFSVLALLGGGAGFAAWRFVSDQQIYAFLNSSGDPNSAVNASDIAFIQSWRLRILLLSLLLALASIGLYLFRAKLSPWRTVRPWGGIAIVALVFFVGSPFALTSWQTFIYDFGTELKSNAQAGGELQALRYIERYVHHESVVVLVFFVIGFALACHKRVDILLPTIYLVISYGVLASATRGYDRYWTPLLPIVFMVAAYGIFSVRNALLQRSRLLASAFLIGVLLLIGVELTPRIWDRLGTADHRDVFYNSYVTVVAAEPERVFYAGYAPYAELEMEGYSVSEIPVAWLEDGNDHLQSVASPGTVVILDAVMNQHAGSDFHHSFLNSWASNEGYGQYVYVYQES